MTHEHPVRYLVTGSRHSHVMHSQLADTRDEADALAAKFGAAEDADVDITEVHDKAETDLTTDSSRPFQVSFSDSLYADDDCRDGSFFRSWME